MWRRTAAVRKSSCQARLEPVAGVAHEARHAALAGLGQVQVLEVLGLVDDEQVDAESSQAMPGRTPTRGQLHHLRDPGGDALLEDGLLPLGELLALPRVALAELDLALDGLGGSA